MMKYLPFHLLWLLLAACSPPPDQSGVPLFNELIFSLQPGEQALPPDGLTAEAFRRYTASDSSGLQLPLFKYIRHPQYELFIALPVGASLDELNNRRPRGPKLSSGPDFYYDSWQQDNRQLTEYGVTKGSNLFVIIAVARSPGMEERFRRDALAARIYPKS
jgi:hypothetical protein